MASRQRTEVVLAMLMAACAGFVDVACFLRLNKIFSSFMTGNTSHLGYDINHPGAGDAASYGWAIACFVFGLVFSASLEHAERRSGFCPSFAAVLLLEDVLLAIYIWYSGVPSSSLWLLIFLTCFAMGMQTVTITRVGKQRVWTTFQTGNLAKFGENFSAYLFWFHDRTRGRFRRRLPLVLRVTPRYKAARHAAATLGVWLIYLAGAFAGGSGESAWGSVCLWIPIGVLAGVAVFDIMRPGAAGEPQRDMGPTD